MAIFVFDQNRHRGQACVDTLLAAHVEPRLFQSFEELMRAIAQGLPDLVLVACDVATTEYLDNLARLSARLHGRTLLAYTEHCREVTRLRSIEMGADDMIPIEALLQSVSERVAFIGRAAAAEATGRKVAADAIGRGQMYFQLKANELSNALQFLCMTSRVGQLTLLFQSDEKGHVYLNRNTVVHCEFKSQQGLAALAAILSQGDMEGYFFEGKTALAETLDMPISQLLIEVSVLADELMAHQTT